MGAPDLDPVPITMNDDVSLGSCNWRRLDGGSRLPAEQRDNRGWSRGTDSAREAERSR